LSSFHLNEIYTPPNALPAADIVFLHGLGDAFKTCWQNSSSTDDEIWPVWLAESFPGVAIWGLDYPTSKFSTFLNAPDLSIFTVAASLAELLRAKKIGQRPIVFICHSLGGVIAKAILRTCESSTTPQKKAVFDNCKGVAFIASPHSGASLPTLLSLIPGVASRQTKELVRANAVLTELHGWYQGKAPTSGVSTCALYETMPTKGVTIVDSGSANPGVPNCDPVPIDANHVDICKFHDKEQLGFLSINNFLEEVFDAASIDTSDHSSLDDLEYYISTVKGDRLTLAEKLEIGGKGDREIDDAEAEKERIHKLVRRNAISASARKKYRQFLSEILTLFRIHVAPLIRSGEDEITVNSAIHAKLLEPLSAKVGANDLFNIADIHSAIFYLTGNCHIDWAKTND